MINRRDFIKTLAAYGSYGAYGGLVGCGGQALDQDLSKSGLYNPTNPFGSNSLRLMIYGNTNGLINPEYCREFSPFVSQNFVQIDFPNDTLAHYLYQDGSFEELARRFGKTGGYLTLKKLISHLRSISDAPSIVIDSGSSWYQGQAYERYSHKIVELSNMISTDFMVMGNEWLLSPKILVKNLKQFNGEVLSFNYTDGKQYKDLIIRHKVKTVGDRSFAFIGMSFYSLAQVNPSVINHSVEIKIAEEKLQLLIEKLQKQKIDCIILFSHNYIESDIKLASRVSGISYLISSQSSLFLPSPITVENTGTKIISSGCNLKSLSLLDISLTNPKEFIFKQIPLLADQINAEIITLSEPNNMKLAKTSQLLYQKSNHIGTVDTLINQAVKNFFSTELAFGVGNRASPSYLTNSHLTINDAFNIGHSPYPFAYALELYGKELRQFLENYANQWFNEDPYKRIYADFLSPYGFKVQVSPYSKEGYKIGYLKKANNQNIANNTKYSVAIWGMRPKLSNTSIKRYELGHIVAKYLQNSHSDLAIADKGFGVKIEIPHN